jgi:hypothetical protein
MVWAMQPFGLTGAGPEGWQQRFCSPFGPQSQICFFAGARHAPDGARTGQLRALEHHQHEPSIRQAADANHGRQWTSRTVRTDGASCSVLLKTTAHPTFHMYQVSHNMNARCVAVADRSILMSFSVHYFSHYGPGVTRRFCVRMPLAS